MQSHVDAHVTNGQEGITPEAKTLFTLSNRKIKLLCLVVFVAGILQIMELALNNKPCFRIYVTTETSSNITFTQMWREVKNTTNAFLFKWKAYRVTMEERNMNVSMDILRAFTRAMDKNNLTYFVYGGTLIGALRHHGPIPWDDDLDVMTPYKQKDVLLRTLKQLEPNYFLYRAGDGSQWKLYSKDSIPYPDRPGVKWKYPYLDIFLFKEEGDEYLDYSWKIHHGTDVRIPKGYVFPLQKRPFADLEVYAPCDSVSFLNLWYSWDTCVSSYWDHSTESSGYIIPRRVACDRLAHIFPFVVRYETGPLVIENLIFKGKIVKSRTLPKLC